MKQPESAHLSQSWRVHSLAQDFDLLDVWRFPITAAPPDSFADFCSFLLSPAGGLGGGSGAARFLFKLRSAIGRVMGWDGEAVSEPIPGSDQYSVGERLSADDRARDLGPFPDQADANSAFKIVFRFENEALLEISNATVHALLHLGQVPLGEAGAGGAAAGQVESKNLSWAPQMAVYVRSRGRLGSFYMKLIQPFRHWIVYPAMMRSVSENWSKRT